MNRTEFNQRMMYTLALIENMERNASYARKNNVNNDYCKCKCENTNIDIVEGIIRNIDQVIYNDPATIICFKDGTKTIVKCQPGDTYSPETGFLMALVKKMCGNTSKFNQLLKEFIPYDED